MTAHNPPLPMGDRGRTWCVACLERWKPPRSPRHVGPGLCRRTAAKSLGRGAAARPPAPRHGRGDRGTSQARQAPGHLPPAPPIDEDRRGRQPLETKEQTRHAGALPGYGTAWGRINLGLMGVPVLARGPRVGLRTTAWGSRSCRGRRCESARCPGGTWRGRRLFLGPERADGFQRLSGR